MMTAARWAAIVVIAWLAVHSRCLGEQPYTVKQTLRSPVGNREFVVVSMPSRAGGGNPTEEFIGKLKDGVFVEARNLTKTPYTHEYHGNGWILGETPGWTDNRFLWFQDGNGVFIADAETNAILVNDLFAGYSKSPSEDRWAAIRFRPTTRTQERLEEDFQDTVLLLDPEQMAWPRSASTSPYLLEHVLATKPGGIALAKPEWSADGSTFAIVTWNHGAVEAVRYDQTLREIGRSVLPLDLDGDAARSISLNANFAQITQSVMFAATPSQTATPTVRHNDAAASVTPMSPVTDKQQSLSAAKGFRDKFAVRISVGVLLLVGLFLVFRRVMLGPKTKARRSKS